MSNLSAPTFFYRIAKISGRILHHNSEQYEQIL